MRIRLGVVAVAAAILAVPSSPGEARPKAPKLSICTDVKVIHSPGGQRCTEKQRDDLINNRKYSHVVVCDPELGNMCCKTDGAGRWFDCTAIRLATSRPTRAPEPGGVAPPR